jgi:excisionase family DNA binding protein
MDEFQKTDKPNSLLTVRDVAALLAVQPRTVLGLHRTGRLLGFKIGRELRWRPSDVQTFITDLPEAVY